jgi:hypothetical protein
MYRIEVIDGVATMVPRDAPAPAPEPEVCVRPEDTIVLRPNKPLKVVFAKDAEEVELEVREIEPEPEPVPLNKYRILTPEECIIDFARDLIREADDDCFANKTEVYEEFKKWYAVNHGKNVPKSAGVYDYMTKRFGKLEKKGWRGCMILYDDEEEEEETKVVIPDEFVYNDCVECGSQKIYRHPIHREYGCDFETGEIFHFKYKRNEVNNKLTVNLKNGITLSLGQDSDGNRVQKHYLPHKFVGETALHYKKITQRSAFHTKLMINTKCDAYTKRPHIKLYPLGCLIYTADGTPDRKGEANPMNSITSNGDKGIVDGAYLRDRVKTADQIDAFMAQVRRENEKLKNKLEARDAEVAKLKEQLQEKNDEINKLKDDNERYQEHSKSPLKAGAVQLQELLMTEHQGSTVMEMLQFCFKDITRNYPKRDDEEYDRSEENFIFEMSPRGLPYDNEHITR